MADKTTPNVTLDGKPLPDNRLDLSEVVNWALTQSLFPKGVGNIALFNGFDPNTGDPALLGTANRKTHDINVFQGDYQGTDGMLRTLLHEISHVKSDNNNDSRLNNSFIDDTLNAKVFDSKSDAYNAMFKVTKMAKDLLVDSSADGSFEEIRANSAGYLAMKELQGPNFKPDKNDKKVQKLLDANPEFANWVGGLGGKYIDSPRLKAPGTPNYVFVGSLHK